jgi:[ribosomal protein S18]-alanine N-acetyltransferase
MSEVTVRTYEPRDIPAILALERACAGAPQWDEAFWSGGFFGDATLRGVFVAEIDEQVCGYSVASYVAGIAELESVAVSTSVRENGLGSALCELVMLWARKCGAKSIELEVRESNVAALGLYRRLGFIEQDKRKRYYKDPEEDAVLMTAKL